MIDHLKLWSLRKNKLKNREELVREFNVAMGQPDKVNLLSKGLDVNLLMLRKNLISEETDEVCGEVNYILNKRDDLFDEDYTPRVIDVEDLFKELGDLQYVLSGLCATYDIPMDEILEEVHQSNMSKLDDNGKPIMRDDGKVLKGPNYQEENMMPIVEKYFQKYQKGADEPTFI